jgi:hypothetical protein
MLLMRARVPVRVLQGGLGGCLMLQEVEVPVVRGLRLAPRVWSCWQLVLAGQRRLLGLLQPLLLELPG